jgi:hypothetical protein
MGLRIHCPTQTLQCPLKVKVELRTSMWSHCLWWHKI